MKKKYLLYLAIPLIIVCCKKKDDDKITPTKTVTIISSGNLDGHIINSTPRVIKDVENSLDMGWNGGASMRSFLSFDITSINNNSEYKLVIESATLKVYEKNTNMIPFEGGGIARVVETFMLDYGTLDAADFDRTTFADCGVLTNWGYNVLKEYTQNVTPAVYNYIGANAFATKLQFRLQFTNNDNVPTTSTLSNAMWRIFAGDDQGTSYNSYRPVLVITYHTEKK